MDRGEIPHLSCADSLADRPPLHQDSRALHQGVAGDGAGGPAEHNRLGAVLQDVELPVHPVLAPLDVHRAAVVRLDDKRVAGELLDFCIGEAEAATDFLANGDEVHGLSAFAGVGVDPPDGLFAEGALKDRQPSGRGTRRGSQRPGPLLRPGHTTK
jgi:hypothetical protein